MSYSLRFAQEVRITLPEPQNPPESFSKII